MDRRFGRRSGHVLTFGIFSLKIFTKNILKDVAEGKGEGIFEIKTQFQAKL